MVIDFSTEFAKQRIKAMQIRFGLFAGVLISIILTMTRIFLRLSFIQRLIKLQIANKEIASGNFVRIEETNQRDELQDLGHNFKTMVEALQTNIENLQLIEHKGRVISGSITLAILVRDIQKTFSEIAHVTLGIIFYVSADLAVLGGLPKGYYFIGTEGRFSA